MINPFVWKFLAVIALAGGIVSGAYIKGRTDANAKCRAAEFQAQVAALQRDIAVQREADAAETEAVIELEADAARMEKEIEAYAKKLAERPADARCLLDDEDLKDFGGSR